MLPAVFQGRTRPSKTRRMPTFRRPKCPAQPRGRALCGLQLPGTTGPWTSRDFHGSARASSGCPVLGRAPRIQPPPRPATSYLLRPFRGGVEKVIEFWEHSELQNARGPRMGRWAATDTAEAGEQNPPHRTTREDCACAIPLAAANATRGSAALGACAETRTRPGGVRGGGEDLDAEPCGLLTCIPLAENFPQPRHQEFGSLLPSLDRAFFSSQSLLSSSCGVPHTTKGFGCNGRTRQAKTLALAQNRKQT